MWNKADQILRNEIRKIDVKIIGHESAIRKLRHDKAEIEKSINRDRKEGENGQD